ncbi:hypothetical protein MJ524_06555 [Escherichia coli]|nr:hypothetical protein MJ524_06555 [Escherichia coli]
MRKNAFVVEHPLNQHFNLAAAGFTPKQARRDHAGIIKNQKIAGVESLSSKSVKVPRVSAPVGPSSDSKRQLLRSGHGIVGNQGIRAIQKRRNR